MVKMKTSGIYLLIILSIGISGLSACKTNASIPQQITSLNVGCKTQDVQIFDEADALNGEQTWVAKCDGKVYTCSYFPESGSDCYELTE
jgi:hypothetical protein